MNKEKLNRLVLNFIIIALCVLVAAGFLSQGLFIETQEGLYKCFFVRPGKEFSLKFIHSVQRTPVIENFVITGRGTLRLESTVYQSLGVGLPFLPEEGTFRQEKGNFIFEQMQREFDYIELRTGPEAKLTFIYEGTSYYLYDTLAYASLVRISSQTWASYLMRKFEYYYTGKEKSP